MPEPYLRKLSDLMEKYQKALEEKNIEAAMEFGQAYFRTYRNGDLRDEDRERIQNDIYGCMTSELKMSGTDDS